MTSRCNGADELVRRLYSEHGGAILAHTTILTRDRGAAENVTQETLVRAWQHRDALVNGKGSVRGWLLTTATNIVIDLSRRRKVRPTEVSITPDQTTSAVDHAKSVVDGVVVRDALVRLRPEHREVLVEVYLKGSSMAEAADVLDLPIGTVKSRSTSARRAMRELLAG
ncbi:sigma-70 family RNA polymerase sigma factor [Umezawaea sp. Da 62-37]|uniref:sigma-70 family RNA polymerase sigma factor n=1 Tax=Umezawaea sp. Da 62-37 TaxID=3075927 RepID=UPI0028F728D3|nr:sigma-70 family RNA polymerase sigma factor [Umezawaea sp. Da 62-37]WNV88515.1 sigma-70 family RNA polymerase sigma factor [Umezawaea sp. Da 62-37]